MRNYRCVFPRVCIAIRVEHRGFRTLVLFIAAAKDIVSHKNPGLLEERGGPLNLGQSWAESFLCRHRYVKRKATKAARKLPENYAEAKLGFLQRIKSEVDTWSIPHTLIIN